MCARLRRADVPEAFQADTRASEFNNGDAPPEVIDDDSNSPENIAAYNTWAAEYEHVLAKALFSSGTTWAGVMQRDDSRAYTPSGLDLHVPRITKIVGC